MSRGADPAEPIGPSSEPDWSSFFGDFPGLGQRTVLGPMAGVDSGAAQAAAEAPSRSLHTLPEGTRLLDYEIAGVVGEGGFGIVYLAYDAQLERHVAIKEYLPATMASRASSREVIVKSPRHEEAFHVGMRSFVNEARLLARFDHPSLIKVLRFWEGNGTAYMVMPFYDGPTLSHALQTLGRPPTEDELRSWLRPLLHALSTLHAVCCYHRDIAPDNILLTPSGPLLLDFGAARRVVGKMATSPTVVIKPGYAPIEQYGEAPTLKQGPWTDLYALAGVVYAAIAGRPPLAAVERWIDDRLEPLSVLAQGRYSPQFLATIDAALATKPADRPASAAEFWSRLTEADAVQTPLTAAAPASFVVPEQAQAQELEQDQEPEQQPVPQPEPEPEPEQGQGQGQGQGHEHEHEHEHEQHGAAVRALEPPFDFSDEPRAAVAAAVAAAIDADADADAASRTGAAAFLQDPPSLGTVAQPWERRRSWTRYLLLALLLVLGGGWVVNALRGRLSVAAPPAVLSSAAPKPSAASARSAPPSTDEVSEPVAPEPAAKPSGAAAPALLEPSVPPSAPRPQASPRSEIEIEIETETEPEPRVAAAPPASTPPPAKAASTAAPTPRAARPESPRVAQQPAARSGVPAAAPASRAAGPAPASASRAAAPAPVDAKRRDAPAATASRAETARRCTAILQQASIEPLRSAEAAFLKRECRK